jgi:DNA polymerase III sliding clamp (beta) subunit (PCNA family)
MAPGVPVALAFSPAEDGGAPGRGGDPRPVEGMISFESGGRRLTGRLIAGEFIKYESRFPAGYGCLAEMPAASLIEAVRRVSLVADRTSPVRLTFEQGTVALEAQTEGRARAVERVTASFHGDEPVIAFNPHYLLDGLTAAAAGSGPPRNQAAAGPQGTDGAGEQGVAAGAPAGGAHAAAAVTVRLEFTSPAKPALITLAGDTGTAPVTDGADGGASGADGAAGEAGATSGGPVSGGPPSRPEFRYLVVPLRSPARG